VNDVHLALLNLPNRVIDGLTVNVSQDFYTYSICRILLTFFSSFSNIFFLVTGQQG